MRVSPQKSVTPNREEKDGRAEEVVKPLKIKQEVTSEEETTPVKLKMAIKEEIKDEEMDYMEGITEDMFWGDDDFEREGLTPSKTDNSNLDRGAGCSSWGAQPPLSAPASRRLKLEDEDLDGEGDPAEPLPDSLFGLLGVREGLLEPQGRLQDLPGEVLTQVFSLLPAADLYGTIQRVCRTWRNIVTDPKVRGRDY